MKQRKCIEIIDGEEVEVTWEDDEEETGEEVSPVSHSSGRDTGATNPGWSHHLVQDELQQSSPTPALCFLA